MVSRFCYQCGRPFDFTGGWLEVPICPSCKQQNQHIISNQISQGLRIVRVPDQYFKTLFLKKKNK